MTDDDSQWRPQLVTHVGQKFRFQTIGLIETRVQITQLIDPKVQSLVHRAQIFTGSLGTFDNPVERFRQSFKFITRTAREPRIGLAIFKRLCRMQQAHDWRQNQSVQRAMEGHKDQHKDGKTRGHKPGSGDQQQRITKCGGNFNPHQLAFTNNVALGSHFAFICSGDPNAPRPLTILGHDRPLQRAPLRVILGQYHDGLIGLERFSGFKATQGFIKRSPLVSTNDRTGPNPRHQKTHHQDQKGTADEQQASASAKRQTVGHAPIMANSRGTYHVAPCIDPAPIPLT